MKNWLPFVLGPALAMLRMPAPVSILSVSTSWHYSKQTGKGVLVKGLSEVGEVGGYSTLQLGTDLILEFFTIDAAAAAARARRVAALDHEVGNDAVEDGAVVVAARGERREVLARLGRVLRVQLDDNGALGGLISWV